ncbi:MAG TPA: hypothetical protein VGE65_05350 [Sphingobium sp.]
MRRIGWALAALALLPAVGSLGLRYAGQIELADNALIGFAATFLLGMMLVLISGGIRLARGEVKLRPWDAAKSALLMFGIIMAIRVLAWVVLPSLGRDLIDAVIQSAIFAIAYSLYSTAYRRRPAL